MRICHVTPYFYPATQYGGPVTQVKILCEELAARGHQITVVTTNIGCEDKVPVNSWVEQDGYRIWYLSTMWFNRYPPYFYFRIPRVLKESLRQMELFHLHSSFVHLNYQFGKWAATNNIPFWYSARGALDSQRLRMKSYSKKIFVILFEKYLLKYASKCIATSRPEIAHYHEMGISSIPATLIPNGVKTPQLDLLDLKKRFRQQYQLLDNDFIVLYLGQLVWYKGPQKLLDIALKLHSRHPGMKYVIAGPDAGEENRLKSFVAEHQMQSYVTFTGHLHGEQKWGALAGADIFVLLSDSEGLPNAVLEAAAVGRPVLITEACNLPEVTEYEAGWVVKDSAEAEQVLADCSIDSEKLATYSVRAQTMITQRFSESTVVEQYIRQLD